MVTHDVSVGRKIFLRQLQVVHIVIILIIKDITVHRLCLLIIALKLLLHELLLAEELLGRWLHRHVRLLLVLGWVHVEELVVGRQRTAYSLVSWLETLLRPELLLQLMHRMLLCGAILAEWRHIFCSLVELITALGVLEVDSAMLGEIHRCTVKASLEIATAG